MRSSQARALRTGSTKLIGVIVPKINSESVSRITAGIGQVLGRRGYQMLLANTDNAPIASSSTSIYSKITRLMASYSWRP